MVRRPPAEELARTVKQLSSGSKREKTLHESRGLFPDLDNCRILYPSNHCHIREMADAALNVSTPRPLDEAGSREFHLAETVDGRVFPTADTPYLHPMAVGQASGSRISFPARFFRPQTRQTELGERAAFAQGPVDRVASIYACHRGRRIGHITDVPTDNSEWRRVGMGYSSHPLGLPTATPIRGSPRWQVRIADRTGIQQPRP